MGADDEQSWYKTRARTGNSGGEKAREIIFNVNDEPLEAVSEFKYLGRILLRDDSEWARVRLNVKKMLQRILTREMSDIRICRMFYKVIFQSVLLCARTMWDVSSAELSVLDSFYQIEWRVCLQECSHSTGVPPCGG